MDVPWPGFRILWRVWIGAVVLIALLSPIIATDLMVMLPLATMVLLGGSTLKRYAEQRPSCHRCALPLDHPED